MVAIGRLDLWVVFAVAVGAPSGGSGDAPPDVRAAVARLKQELVEAYVRCDASALERIYADDFTVTDAEGVVRRKADELAEARAGRCGLISGRYEPVAVRAFGDLAVMSGHATLVLRGEQGPREMRYYSFNVFRREAGGWRYVAAFTP